MAPIGTFDRNVSCRYPSATLLPNGKVLIMGGTQGVGAGTANNPFWEMYEPLTNSLTPYPMSVSYLEAAQQVRDEQHTSRSCGRLRVQIGDVMLGLRPCL